MQDEIGDAGIPRLILCLRLQQKKNPCTDKPSSDRRRYDDGNSSTKPNVDPPEMSLDCFFGLSAVEDVVKKIYEMPYLQDEPLIYIFVFGFLIWKLQDKSSP